MAQIKIDLPTSLLDGMDIKFQAPCDCTAITGLQVHYPTEDEGTASKSFIFKDSRGYELTGLGNLFSAGAYVKVMLDSVNGFAYIQNAGACAFAAVAELSADKWQDNTQTVSVRGVETDNMVVISAAPEDFAAYGEAGIRCIAQSAGALTFACNDVPSGAVKAHVVILT